ncbi:MAG: hypothetical protein ACT4O0_17810 [Pseudonocardia sp.]|jgi:hypothetical protein
MNPEPPAPPRRRPAVFGRPDGPARLALAVGALLVLLIVSVTIARLDARLGAMVDANEATVVGAARIAVADDRFTRRLQQLDAVAANARRARDQTQALAPLLVELRDALRPAATDVATGRAGGERTAVQLAHIRALLQRLRDDTADLATSTSAFTGQGADLLRVLDGLAIDLRASLEAAERIDAALPALPTGGR